MCFYAVYFLKPQGKKMKNKNAHREMAQCGTAESTLYLSLSFVLMGGNNCSSEILSSMQAIILTVGQLHETSRKRQEALLRNLWLHCREQCTWLAHNFWSLFSALTFSASIFFTFFLPGLVLHPLLSFQAPTLIIILLSHCLQLLILFQLLV